MVKILIDKVLIPFRRYELVEHFGLIANLESYIIERFFFLLTFVSLLIVFSTASQAFEGIIVQKTTQIKSGRNPGLDAMKQMLEQMPAAHLQPGGSLPSFTGHGRRGGQGRLLLRHTGGDPLRSAGVQG